MLLLCCWHLLRFILSEYFVDRLGFLSDTDIMPDKKGLRRIFLVVSMDTLLTSALSAKIGSATADKLSLYWFQIRLEYVLL